jgi:hypothetical protein
LPIFNPQMGDFQVAGPVLALGLNNVSLPVPLNASRPGPAHDSLNDLPSGYPTCISHPFAWTGADFVDETSFVYRLSAAEKLELRQAKDHFKGTRP